MKKQCVLTLQVEYDSEVTDPEGLANALDIVMDTALSTPGILEEYGNPKVGDFLVSVEGEGHGPDRLADRTH